MVMNADASTVEIPGQNAINTQHSTGSIIATADEVALPKKINAII